MMKKQLYNKSIKSTRSIVYNRIRDFTVVSNRLSVLLISIYVIIVLLIIPVSTSTSYTREIDIVFFHKETHNSIIMGEELEFISAKSAYSLSNQYVLSLNNNIGNSISIYNITSANKTEIETHFSPIGIAAHSNKTLYYNYSCMVLFDIDEKSIELIINNRTRIENVQFNDKFILFREFYYGVNWYVIEIKLLTIIKLGTYNNAILYMDNVLLQENNINSKSIYLYNITSNITQKQYEGSGFTQIIGIDASYIAWRLDNGSFLIYNRQSNKSFSTNEISNKIDGFSSNKTSIIYINKEKYQSNEIIEYNINIRKFIRLTHSNEINENNPLVNDNGDRVWANTINKNDNTIIGLSIECYAILICIGIFSIFLIYKVYKHS